MHHIINSCTNISKIYGNKDAKSCTTWSFPSYCEEKIHWETCWHVNHICRVINSLNADTAIRLDFTKIRPQKVSPLISFLKRFASVLNLSASADDPFSQGKPTTTWWRRSMHRKSNGRANGSKTLYTTHNAEPRMHGNIIARNYFENWRRQKRLSD